MLPLYFFGKNSYKNNNNSLLVFKGGICMIIKRIPIQDLILFLEEESDTFEKKTNVIDTIKKHYKSLTDIEINIEPYIFESMCFCDHGKIKNQNYPIIDGLLVKNKKGQYGLVYQGYHTRDPEAQKNSLCVWVIVNGVLINDSFNPNEWEEWGVMTTYYDYPNYNDGLYCFLGQREIQKGMIGRDVYLLQSKLKERGEKISINGEFDSDTWTAIMNIQKTLCLPVTGTLNKRTLEMLFR